MSTATSVIQITDLAKQDCFMYADYAGRLKQNHYFTIGTITIPGIAMIVDGFKSGEDLSASIPLADVKNIANWHGIQPSNFGI